MFLSQRVSGGVIYAGVVFHSSVMLGHVGNEVVVTDECIIGAACSVDGTESLPHRTIICGSKNQRYLLAQPPSVSPCLISCSSSFFFSTQSRIQQLDYLTRVLPNFHKLIKGKVSN